MIKMATLISKSLLTKPWQFMIPAEGMTFVTSDNPVTFKPTKENNSGLIGPEHPFSEIRMPLRRDLAVIVTPLLHLSEQEKENAHGLCFQLTPGKTKSFNKSTAAAARRFVFADRKSDALARMVGKLKGTEQKLIMPDVPKVGGS